MEWLIFLTILIEIELILLKKNILIFNAKKRWIFINI